MNQKYTEPFQKSYPRFFPDAGGGFLNLDKKSLKTFFKEKSSLETRWSNGLSQDEIIALAESMWDTSAESALALLKVSPVILPLLSKKEYLEWAQFGRIVLNASSRASDLCQAFFQSSASLLTSGSFHQLKMWVEQGLEIAERSVLTAIQFFQSTPAFLEHDETIHLRPWAEWAMQILTAGTTRGNAASAFFRASTDIIRFMSFRELKDWTAAGIQIAKHSAGLACTYFSRTPQELDALYVSERLSFFRLVSLLAESNPEQAVAFYRSCPKALLTVSPSVRATVLNSTRELSREKQESIVPVFAEIISSISGLTYPLQETTLKQEKRIRKNSYEAGRAFLKNASRILSDIPETFIDHWVKKGLSILRQNPQNGVEYFGLQSPEAHRELARWKEAVILEDHRRLFTFFVHALAGKELHLRSTEDLDPDMSPRKSHYPACDGQTIYLPPFIATGGSHQENFRAYKVAAAHQAGYVEFGTFESGLFSILTLLQTFPMKALATDIFFILEDGRIDHKLKQEYRGLSPDIDLVLSAAMLERPSISELPLQEALVEILLRLTTASLEPAQVPEELANHVVFLKETLSGFYDQAQGVWDSFFKTLKIYDYLRRLPASPAYLSSVPLFFRGILDPDLLPGSGPWKSPPDEILDEMNNEEGVIPVPMSADELKQFLENIKDISKLKFMEAEESFSDGLFITGADISAKGAANESDSENQETQTRPFAKVTSRPTAEDGPFYYDEWDYLAKTYRKRWCCLREKSVEPLECDIIDEIYANYSSLIQQVKRQFQKIRPAILGVSRRVEWGDEIDLPAMIQGVVDRRAGSNPSDRIFNRRERKIRKIATLLLIDMSASTDELIPVKKNSLTRPSRQSGISTKAGQNKKIIDIEVESLVVLMEALNTLDDEYAIFGFSGSGREKIDFYRIKDFSDSYAETLKKRISGIKPRQSTRMGPAIRHAITKLRSVESEQRLLILLSDGFPQDQDYGEDRRSNEYGLHDTMMALLEAKKEGIQPFCITVDQSGNDYLRKMCDPNNYLIIKDIHSLPETLPRVVESLIT